MIPATASCPKFASEGEETLKYKFPAVLVLVVLSVAIALAQTSPSTSTPVVFGQGSSNFIPIWTGGSTLGNSVMFQSGGNVGVGTTSPGSALDVVSGGSTAVRGISFGTAGFANGVVGESSSPDGNGVIGQNRASNGGSGVRGVANGTSGFAIGVLGESYAPSGDGVFGVSQASSGGAGVFGAINNTSGVAVFGVASATSGSPTGVVGFVESPNAVAGQFVTHGGSGLILQGLSGINKQQVFTIDGSGNGFLAGNLAVTGTVSKGGGSFKIDHPLDPSNKTLSHSFVESPDMMNIYNGVVNLDSKGQASVSLPDWFESLNGDYRYLLTAIGAPQPELYIAEEIHGNRFKIAGGKPAAKVSWQVTGIRHDAYANAHRIRVEEDKSATERGSYMHPEAARPQETKGATKAQRR